MMSYFASNSRTCRFRCSSSSQPGALRVRAATCSLITGTIASKHAQHGFGRSIVLEVEHLRIVITEGPSMVMRPSFYTDVGLSLWKADIAVVKNFFPFLLFFLPYNRKTIFVRTHGTTDFDAAFELSFDGPVHPRDAVGEWRSRDSMRRLGTAPPTSANDPIAAASS